MARGKKISSSPLGAEAREIIDREVKARLKMSGDEFVTLMRENKLPEGPEAFELSVLVNMLK